MQNLINQLQILKDQETALRQQGKDGRNKQIKEILAKIQNVQYKMRIQNYHDQQEPLYQNLRNFFEYVRAPPPVVVLQNYALTKVDNVKPIQLQPNEKVLCQYYIQHGAKENGIVWQKEPLQKISGNIQIDAKDFNKEGQKNILNKIIGIDASNLVQEYGVSIILHCPIIKTEFDEFMRDDAIRIQSIKLGDNLRNVRYDDGRKIFFSESAVKYDCMNKILWSKKKCTDFVKEKITKNKNYVDGENMNMLEFIDFLTDRKLRDQVYLIGKQQIPATLSQFKYQVFLDTTQEPAHAYISHSHKHMFQDMKDIMQRINEAKLVNYEGCSGEKAKSLEQKTGIRPTLTQFGLLLEDVLYTKKDIKIMNLTKEVFGSYKQSISIFPLIQEHSQLEERDIELKEYKFDFQYLKPQLEFEDDDETTEGGQDARGVQPVYYDMKSAYLTAFNQLQQLAKIVVSHPVNKIITKEDLKRYDLPFYFRIQPQKHTQEDTWTEQKKQLYKSVTCSTSIMSPKTMQYIFAIFPDAELFCVEYYTCAYSDCMDKIKENIQTTYKKCVECGLLEDSKTSFGQYYKIGFGKLIQDTEEQILSYYDNQEYIQQIPITRLRRKNNNIFIHAQMFDKMMQIMLQFIYKNNVDQLLYIKTDGLIYSRKQQYINEYFTDDKRVNTCLIPHRELPPPNYQQRGDILRNKKIIQTYAGSGKTTLIQTRLLEDVGSKLVIVPTLMTKQQYAKFSQFVDIRCFAFFEKINQQNTIFNYDNIYVDEFGLFPLQMIENLLYQQPCRDNQQILIVGDIYQNTNFTKGNCQYEYRKILIPEITEYRNVNYRNGYNWEDFLNKEKDMMDFEKLNKECKRLGLYNHKHANEKTIFISQGNLAAFRKNKEYQEDVEKKLITNPNIIYRRGMITERRKPKHFDCICKWNDEGVTTGISYHAIGQKDFKAVHTYYGNSYTAYQAQGLQFENMKLCDDITQPQALYVALSRIRTNLQISPLDQMTEKIQKCVQVEKEKRYQPQENHIPEGYNHDGFGETTEIDF